MDALGCLAPRKAANVRRASSTNRRSVSFWHGPTARARALPQLNKSIDDALSNRPLDLDEAGYFILKVDVHEREIVVEHFTNLINAEGASLLVHTPDSS